MHVFNLYWFTGKYLPSLIYTYFRDNTIRANNNNKTKKNNLQTNRKLKNKKAIALPNSITLLSPLESLYMLIC